MIWQKLQMLDVKMALVTVQINTEQGPKVYLLKVHVVSIAAVNVLED